MKKLLAILSVVVLATSCEGPQGPEGPRGPQGPPGSGGIKMIIYDNLIIEPEDWKMKTEDDDRFDYYYANVDIPRFTQQVMDKGSYETYWKYMDGTIPVQEGLGISMHLDRYEEGNGWVNYTETLNCSYSPESIFVTLSRSDFWDGKPGNAFVLRFVAIYE